ncbi:MAG TPA: Trm112 family protein [Gammaproteobacteria bacterium]|nr:Trm112 family protein [Gammaproteobacteria bacterium]
MDRKLLEILCCPVTRRPLLPLSKDKLKRLNALIADDRLQYADGSKIAGPLQEALITDNSTTVYRIEDGIPVMLEDESIRVQDLEGF